jgi:hypothetical protein
MPYSKYFIAFSAPPSPNLGVPMLVPEFKSDPFVGNDGNDDHLFYVWRHDFYHLFEGIYFQFFFHYQEVCTENVKIICSGPLPNNPENAGYGNSN